MQLSELKLITAGNLINLRTRENMTQAELGAKLNYSDKTISKWERGEAIPDAFVLTQLAEIFNVSVDYILSSHDTVEVCEGIPIKEDAPKFRAAIIMAIVVVGIMTCALTAFVVLWLCDIIEWRVFLVGASLSLLSVLVLDCVWYKRKGLQYIISAFVVSLFVIAYFAKPSANAWQLFLIAVPAVALVFLACNVRINPEKRRKIKKK